MRYKNEKKVFYLLLLRAIYGCIESALLWYNIFSTTIEGIGFEINPYERCVSNIIIEGAQCTIAWYVDDRKMSQETPALILNIINKVKKRFGNLYVVRGNKHTFLGTNIDIKYNIIKFDRVKRLEEYMKMFVEDHSALVSYPTTMFLVKGR